jgi:hypothetical protein
MLYHVAREQLCKNGQASTVERERETVFYGARAEKKHGDTGVINIWS